MGEEEEETMPGDEKHSNTEYVKQKFKCLQETKIHVKNKIQKQKQNNKHTNLLLSKTLQHTNSAK